MGHINEVDLEKYIKNYNIKNYFETGTGMGDCLSYIMNNHEFDRYITVEINEQIHNNAKQRLSNIDKNAEFYLGTSKEVLEKVLPEVEGSTLFFLDAHFPGADFQLAQYWDEKDEDLRIPLKKELETIINFKKGYEKDVIVIDDLRIYEDGPYEGGNWDLRHIAGSNDISFVKNLLGKTHRIYKSYKSQGFLIALPRQ
jgi:hypothetical protein